MMQIIHDKKMHFEEEIRNIDFTTILQTIFAESTKLNQEFDSATPWVLVKGDDAEKERAFNILSSLLPRIKRVVDALEPFCPHVSNLLMKNLELKEMPQVICGRLK